MPLSINHMKNDKRVLSIEYAGETVNFTYKPSELTPTILGELREANEQGNDNFTVQVLCKLIVVWDVTDDATPPVTLEIIPEVLGDLPSAFLSAILTACTEDMFGKKKIGRK